MASAQTMLMHNAMCRAEPLDCSSPDVLDLCVRKKPRPATPEKIYESKSPYGDPPTSVLCFGSPNSQGSDTSETSTYSEQYSVYPVSDTLLGKTKVPRPFKAFPKDPLTMAAAAETILGTHSAEAYVEFRHRMLSQVQNPNQGTNVKMRRTSMSVTSSQNSDPTYWEKRKKNNEAAKRSRDARRAKEDEIAIRCAFLEQENIKLRYEVATLRNELERIRPVIYSGV